MKSSSLVQIFHGVSPRWGVLLLALVTSVSAATPERFTRLLARPQILAVKSEDAATLVLHVRADQNDPPPSSQARDYQVNGKPVKAPGKPK